VTTSPEDLLEDAGSGSGVGFLGAAFFAGAFRVFGAALGAAALGSTAAFLLGAALRAGALDFAVVFDTVSFASVFDRAALRVRFAGVLRALVSSSAAAFLDGAGRVRAVEDFDLLVVVLDLGAAFLRFAGFASTVSSLASAFADLRDGALRTPLLRFNVGAALGSSASVFSTLSEPVSLETASLSADLAEALRLRLFAGLVSS